MTPNHKNEALCAAAQQPVSNEVMVFVEMLAKRAQNLAERVNGKLHSVMTSEMPRTCDGAIKDGREYPPLFSELRNNFNTIESALDSIEYAMQRTEL